MAEAIAQPSKARARKSPVPEDEDLEVIVQKKIIKSGKKSKVTSEGESDGDLGGYSADEVMVQRRAGKAKAKAKEESSGDDSSAMSDADKLAEVKQVMVAQLNQSRAKAKQLNQEPLLLLGILVLPPLVNHFTGPLISSSEDITIAGVDNSDSDDNLTN